MRRAKLPAVFNRGESHDRASHFQRREPNGRRSELPHGRAARADLSDDFQLLERFADRERNPRRTVISGSADYGARPVTIDLTDYVEIKAPPQTAKRANPFLHAAVGPLIAFAAAAVVAATLSVLPAPDRPALVAGPLSGHSILHFPR